MKEAAEDELEVGIRHFVREDGTVMGEWQMVRQGESLQAVAGYNIKVRHHAQALLDKITPVNCPGFRKIMDDLLGIELHNGEELKCILRSVFKKAIEEPAHGETCARIAVGFRERYPEFRPENESQKPLSFIRALVPICQEEFESMPITFEASQLDKAKFPRAETLQAELTRRKHRMLACVSFLGHLFLERLLAMKVIGQIVHDLIGPRRGDGDPPHEHMIECVLKLLTLVGRTLDADMPTGVELMNSFEARLRTLVLLRSGGTRLYSDQVRSAMIDMLEWRSNAWWPRAHFEHLQ